MASNCVPPVRQTEVGKVDPLPTRWPRIQRSDEYHRFPVPHGKQFGAPKHQTRDFALRHIADVANVQLWGLTQLRHSLVRVAGRRAPVAEWGASADAQRPVTVGEANSASTPMITDPRFIATACG